MSMPTLASVIHPADELARLGALQACGLLNLESDPLFDETADMVRELFGTAFAAVTLIDAEHQWFKAKSGFDLEQAAREGSFCTYCIQFPGVLWVDDAGGDPRFHDSPFVAGPPHVRFYAGAPLRSKEGWRVGTVCAMDLTPRPFDPALAKRLASVADQLSRMLQA